MNRAITFALLVFSIHFQQKINAQCVNVFLSSQSQLDNFTANCPTITTLSIQGDVTDLTKLSMCQNVTGNLTISANNLITLHGLHNIQNVGGSVSIYATDLVNLKLNSLIQVGGGLALNDLTSLPNLSGLSNLQKVNGTLKVDGSNLKNLLGLNNLTEVGSLSLIENDSLKSLTGLENLQKVNVNLTIEDNQGLIGLKGLSNLTSIGSVSPNPNSGNLVISNNHHLINLQGLNRLKSIDNNLVVTSNASLMGLTGLDSLTSISGAIDISGTSLHLCAIPTLCNLIGQATSVSITGGGGCEGVDEVISYCSGGSPCPEDLNIRNQNQIDSFSVIFPNCNHVGGMYGLDIFNQSSLYPITNFNGLNQLVTLDRFSIYCDDCPNLTNFQGLENLKKINTYFEIAKSYFTDYTGLSNLDTIGTFYYRLSNSNLDFVGLPNLKHIGTIYSSDSIANFRGLESVESVDYLTAEDSEGLINFEGLNNLKHLKKLSVENNQNLTSFRGLENIEKIPERFKIEYNPSLINFEGLNNLKEIGDVGEVRIYKNGIENFHGLENLKKISCSFKIWDNSNLESLAGLSKLNSINGELRIEDNPNLSTLQGIGPITKLDHLRIYGSKLVNLSGMESLDSLGRLTLIGNSQLQTLAGLDNPILYGDYAAITYNPQLSDCSTWTVCNSLVGYSLFTSTLSFSNNKFGCNTANQVINTCNNKLARATGVVYADLDCSGNHDSTDVGLQNQIMVFSQNGLPFGATNHFGDYYFYIPDSTTVTYRPKGISGFSTIPAEHSVTAGNTPILFDSLNFRLCPDSLFKNLEVTLSTFAPPRPGFEQKYQLCVRNIGSVSSDGTLVLDFSVGGFDQYITILDADGGIASSDGKVTYNLNEVQPFSLLCFEITIRLDAATPLGIIGIVEGSITANGNPMEYFLEDNIVTLNQTVVGSYDPNNKLADKPVINYDEVDGPIEIEYTINFQNTGTYPATFVEVYDTLTNEFDIRTIEMITTSHPYSLSILGSNILKWRFDNINLPDSSSNEPNSHGFIRFRISTNETPLFESVIQNKAAIYFDYNTPVITLPAILSFTSGTSDISNQDLQLAVSPNPTSGNIYISFEMLYPSQHCQLQIINLQGQVVKSQNLSILSTGMQTIPVALDGLSAGFYQISFNNGRNIGRGKFIKN